MKVVVVLALASACGVDERFSTLHMQQPRVDDPGKVTAWTLKNGLRVAIYRDPRARETSIDLRYDVGTSDDPYGHPGYALVTGYAITAASAQVPDAELATILQVDLDRTELTTATTDLDRALAMYAKRLGMTCDDVKLDVVEPRALEQLNGIPPSLLQAVWGTAHPYAHELGNQDTEQLDAQAICAFYTAHYGPRAATLVIAGNVPLDIGTKISAAFETLPDRKLAVRAPIPALTPTTQRVRSVVWGLARPTAAIAVPVPATGDQDDVVVELAIRKLERYAQQHEVALHTALVGGRRGRALVIGVEADRESDLGKAHDQLADVLAEANGVYTEGDDSGAVADDQLLDAQVLDDTFLRGERIADMVASGRRIELLRKARAYRAARSPATWLRDHLGRGPGRKLDLIPAIPNQGQAIENLADGPQFIDRSLAGQLTAEPGDPGAKPVIALTRAVEQYTLPNGLHVVLSSDPIAALIDVRLVFPVGTDDEPAPGIALRAATELLVDDGFHAGPDARERVEWYGNAVAHTDVDVTRTSTHFRASGFAVLGDWHLWAVAWRVIAGRYEIAVLEPWKRHFGPKDATLIVTGGFDPKVARPIIERWYGAWKQSTAAPPKPGTHARRRAITYDASEAQDAVELSLAYGPETHPGPRARGAAQLLATLLQQRLALSLRAQASIGVIADVRDRRLILNAQIDPQAAADTAKQIVAELAQLRATGAADAEIANARRRAVAQYLANETAVAGRAAQLEANAIQKLAPNDQTLLDELQTATADDVTDAAQQLIDPATLEATLKATKTQVGPVLKAIGFDERQAERR